MKKISITILILCLFNLFTSSIKANDFTDNLKRVMNKFKKTESNYCGPTAVVGVRGDNVSEKNKNELKKMLYWEN